MKDIRENKREGVSQTSYWRKLDFYNLEGPERKAEITENHKYTAPDGGFRSVLVVKYITH